jgi:dolichol-phosphate mannosyltransferase
MLYHGRPQAGGRLGLVVERRLDKERMAKEEDRRIAQIATPEATAPTLTRGPQGAPELTVVIPTFCERDNIATLVERIDAALAGVAWEIIFVDDNSPDGTAAFVKSIGADDARVRCIRRIGRRGLAGACVEGMLASQASYVAVMDADLQHDERLLADMLARLRVQAADLVIGARYIEGGSAEGLSAVRHSSSRLANVLARKLLRIDIVDLMSGFFMLRRSLIDAVAPRLSTRGFKILVDILASAGRDIRVIELPYQFRARQHGASKLDNQVVLEFLELLIAKMSLGIIPDRFLSFLLIGASGIGVHLAVLTLAHMTSTIGFAWAQTFATVAAMASNFFLNNALTYRDQRLIGFNAVIGLVLFTLICSIGVVSNISVASWLYGQDRRWWLAGLLGAIVSAVWNYAVSRRLVWRMR